MVRQAYDPKLMRLPSRRWKLPAKRCAKLIAALSYDDQLSVIAHLSCTPEVLKARLADRTRLYAAAQACLLYIYPLELTGRRRVIEQLAVGLDALPICWSCGYQYKAVDDASLGKCPECLTDWLPFDSD